MSDSGLMLGSGSVASVCEPQAGLWREAVVNGGSDGSVRYSSTRSTELAGGSRIEDDR